MLLLTTIEIALLIIFPLLVFYRQSSWNKKQYIPSIIFVYIVWYLSYAFLHELCHLSAALFQGLKVYKYQLVPYFWKGELGKGFVDSEYNKYTVIMPYIKDIVFSLIGVIVFKKVKIHNVFFSGLVLTILIFSSLFDVANNFLVFVIYSINDFRAFSELTNKIFANSTGVIFLFITFFSTAYILKNTRNYPVEEKEF